MGVHIADVSHYVAWDDPVDIEAPPPAELRCTWPIACCPCCRSASHATCARWRPARTACLHGRRAPRRRGEGALGARLSERDPLARAPLVCTGRCPPRRWGGCGTPPGCPTCPRAAPRSPRTCARRGHAAWTSPRSCARPPISPSCGAPSGRAGAPSTSIPSRCTRCSVSRARSSTLTGRERTPATGLVEEAMLIANECVAERLVSAGAATGVPRPRASQPDHLGDAAFALLDLGVCDRDQAAAIAAGDQAAMRSVLERAAGTGAAEVANALLLRAMQRAVYRPHNLGHYALGADAYCHFTSPIRATPTCSCTARSRWSSPGALGRPRRPRARAPAGGERAERAGGPAAADLPRRPATPSAPPTRPRAPRRRSRSPATTCRASASGIGGTVAWRTRWGSSSAWTGPMPRSSFRCATSGDEWFSFDARLLTVTGAETGRVVRLGDRVIVEIARANPVRGHLDLKLVHGRH